MKPDLSTYGGTLRDVGYAGQIATLNPTSMINLVNEGDLDIDYGVAVAAGSQDDTCKAPTSDADVIIGLSVRHVVNVADANGNVTYKKGASVPNLRQGDIYAVPTESVQKGDQVMSITAQNGRLGASSNNTASTAVAATKAGGNTGNGTITVDVATPVLAHAIAGVYTARCIAAAANSGTFRVTDPNGLVLGDVVVGATFADQIKFVIADGAADFIVGDGFDVTVAVNTGRVPVPGATWDTTTAAGSVGKIRKVG